VKIASTVAAALESALDLYIRQDPQALQACAALEGKVICVDVTGLDLVLYFFPGSDGIQVLSQYEGPVDTQLRGSPAGFARLSLAASEDALFEGAIEVRGDTEAGQRFQDILAKTDWDWEEQLSRVTGDVVAHQIGDFARRAKQVINGGRKTLEQDVSEYLQEEARLLPTRAETEYFLADVDLLRGRVDRLAARLERLLRTTESDS